jgi:putative transposase
VLVLEYQEPRIADGEIGLDVGLEYFYSDSNGHHEPNPQFHNQIHTNILKIDPSLTI